MNCPKCKTRMYCIDSRDVQSKTYGQLRRRRWECAEHGRFTSAEMLLPEGAHTAETAIRALVDEGFRAAMRTAATHILNLAGGKT